MNDKPLDDIDHMYIRAMNAAIAKRMREIWKNPKPRTGESQPGARPSAGRADQTAMGDDNA